LQDLSDIREVPDIAKPENCDDAVARHQWVNHIIQLQILRDYLSTSLPEAKR
jgi:hypothetical protein